MYQEWEIDGKKGHIIFPKGEVVYQTMGVVIEPIYVDENGRYYIMDTYEEFVGVDEKQFVKVTRSKLLEVMFNPYNGYCYRQDGK